MPKIGVSGPWLATYRNINGVISYTDGFKAARMTQFEGKPDEGGGGDDFYSDNAKSESDRSGSRSGTITESIDNFSQEASRRILGLQEGTVEIDSTEYPYLIYDDNANPEYFGHGIVIKKRKDNRDLWRAVVHRKVMYEIPGDAATTQGGSIEWQAEELTATYMPDDGPTHEWKNDATFDTEALAVAFVETILNFRRLGTLLVTSTAGSTVGTTRVSIIPMLESGNSYKYIIAPNVGAPTYGDVIGDDYTEWDGTEEITAVNGQQILVVEVDAENRAQKGGIAAITTNEGV